MTAWQKLKIGLALYADRIGDWWQRARMSLQLWWAEFTLWMLNTTVGDQCARWYIRWRGTKENKTTPVDEAYQELLEHTGYQQHKDTRKESNVDFKAHTKAESVVKEVAEDVAREQQNADARRAFQLESIEDVDSLFSVMEGSDTQKRLKKIRDRTSARSRTDKALAGLNTERFFKKPDTSTITVSRGDAHLADMTDMADVVPPPRRSKIEHTDLQVYGSWESNPNTHERIQEAGQFPLVDRQITKTIEHLTTSNIRLQGNPEYTDIIRRWLEIDLEYSSNYRKSLSRQIGKIAEQMLRFGSAVVFKQRTRSSDMDSYADPMTGGNRLPLHTFAVPDMTTVEVFVDRKGRPRKWRQHPHLKDRPDQMPTYLDRDVLVAQLPQRATPMYFWTPALATPVLYAIEVLKDLHDTIEAHSQSIVDVPRYVQVGDKDFLDGVVKPKMLDQMSSTLYMTEQGKTLVVPWYVKAETMEKESYTEELISTAEFWNRVVRKGVGGTELDDGKGEGSNRATADILGEKDMRLAQALVPEIQLVFRGLFMDKLLENGVKMADIQSHRDMVSLEFEDIDLTAQQARESHTVFMFQNDGLTHGEFRTRLGEDPDEDKADMYYSDIQQEVELEKIDKKNAQKAETSSRVRPNGKPKPKRKKDSLQAHDDPIV